MDPQALHRGGRGRHYQVKMTQIRHHAHRDGVRKRRQRQHPWRRPSGGERVGPPPLQTLTRDDVLRRLLGRRRGAAHRQRLGREQQQKVRAVLPICADCTAVFFRAPSEEYLDGLTGQSSFGDGAAAVVVGAEPHPKLEKSLFEIQWAGTAVVPDSLEAIAGYPRETGTRWLNFRLFNRMLN